jgi:hypothetical protein
MGTRIFLPLRSNTAWFSDAEAIGRFERLLRIHIALYDRIVLEDGILRLSCDDDGQGFVFTIPPNNTSADRTKLSFCEPGGSFAIAVGGQTVLHGKQSYGCNADFKPILHRAGLNGATYFQWLFGDLVPELKQQTDRLAAVDLEDDGLLSSLPEQPFLQKELLKGFYRDAVIAHENHMTLGIDRHMAAFLEWKRSHAGGLGLPSPAYALLEHWVTLNLPDFSQFSWEQIHELHESDVGEDLRRMVERICSSVISALSNQPTKEDLDSLVASAFNKELIAEVRSRRAGVTRCAVNMLLNFVPYGGVISGMLDANDLTRDRASWISLL